MQPDKAHRRGVDKIRGVKSLNQAAFHIKRIDGAHRRYLDSIKALATVRKLQLPNVQVNIGEKQVNVANMNGAPASMGEPSGRTLEAEVSAS